MKLMMNSDDKFLKVTLTSISIHLEDIVNEVMIKHPFPPTWKKDEDSIVNEINSSY